jgi:hypothetical protein
MWHNFRRFYLYAMTENMKSIVLRHRKVLLSEDMRKKRKLNIERDIFSAATLPELDTLGRVCFLIHLAPTITIA